MSTRSVPPPSLQEVTRKLSVHSVRPPAKKPTPSAVAVSGTESDSDSVFSPDVISPSPMSTASVSGTLLAAASAQPPLSSIAERRSASGEESEEDEEDEEGGWRADAPDRERGAPDEIVIKTGYLWKKGERRKTWKKRWFVLRPAHLAFYKTSAEYKLLRLLDLNEIHSCTPVALKKHANTFGLVSPTRTFYLQAEAPGEVQEWVHAINDARTTLLATSIQASATAPIPIPGSPTTARAPFGASRLSSSPSQSPCAHQFTSSESDDASPNGPHSYPVSSPSGPGCEVSTASKQTGAVKDASKPVLSGYLMKCGSRRHNWHKRWFVLSGEKLIYCRSHMDTKPHRQIPLSLILDALEYDLPPHRNNPNVSGPPVVSPPQASSSAADEGDGTQGTHTFKVVTTKRTLLLCAPSEEEEIKWLSAVRALIARRSGAGVVPGDMASASLTSKPGGSSAAPGSEIVVHGGGAGSGPGPSGAGVPTGRRRDSLVGHARRVSLSGGGAFAGSAGAAGVPQEAASER